MAHINNIQTASPWEGPKLKWTRSRNWKPASRSEQCGGTLGPTILRHNWLQLYQLYLLGGRWEQHKDWPVHPSHALIIWKIQSSSFKCHFQLWLKQKGQETYVVFFHFFGGRGEEGHLSELAPWVVSQFQHFPQRLSSGPHTTALLFCLQTAGSPITRGPD